MRRRFTLPALLLVLCAPGPSALLAEESRSAQTPPSRAPNVILVLADDLGYGDLGSYGQRLILTPQLDRMAREGLRFTQFYAGSPVCAPSRNVIMTGQHSGHVLIRGNAKLDLRPEDQTIAELLKGAGYATGLVGKWGLGQDGSTGAPAAKGFEEFFGYTDQTHAHNSYPTFLVRNGARVPLGNLVPDEGRYGQGVATVRRAYSGDLLVDEAVSFIERHRGGRFFLCFAPTQPHANNEAGAAGMEAPDLGPYANETWPAAEKGFAALVSRLDRDVGRLLSRLRELGLDESTLVLFASDNGPHAEGGHDAQYFRSGGPLRGMKRELYEGGIRVPLIARWPGQVPAGRTSLEVAYLGDFFATVADLAGVSPRAGLDSVSLRSVLEGVPRSRPEREALYWEFYERPSQAVRMGRWKGVRHAIGTGPIELYDLTKDLGEEHDVAAQNPTIVERIKQIMATEHVPSPFWTVKP